MNDTDIKEFNKLLAKYRYDFDKLVFLIFPFGERGHEMEHMTPYPWQLEEWRLMSDWFKNPETRDKVYRLGVSSGNGAAKTAFGAMTLIMFMYTQRLHARLTANTMPQISTVIWPEYDIWFNRARYSDIYFEKTGTSIQARDIKKGKKWRIDTFTWSEESPTAVSGLHNKGGAVAYVFEEAPGIPAIIFDYARGAFTETDTLKLHLAFGNSDDPESKFEQLSQDPLWRFRRIDTRTLPYVNKDTINDILIDCGGDEDHDEFRVRVRGLPRKSARDSIIDSETVAQAIERGRTFDRETVRMLPTILMCDPAWTGGDETTIWLRRGPWAHLLDRYRLDRDAGDTHMLTYQKLCYYEREWSADAVFIDQGEGTAIYTLAVNDGKYWELVAFGGKPNDAMEFKDSEYANMRSQLYYQTRKWLRAGAAITAERTEWIPDIAKQLCWAKGDRHKVHNKKKVEPKEDIKKRVGFSPDVADGLVLAEYRPVTDKRGDWFDTPETGGTAIRIGGGEDVDLYQEVDVARLYD